MSTAGSSLVQRIAVDTLPNRPDSLAGTIPLAGLGRLREGLTGDESSEQVNLSLSVDRDKAGRSWLNYRISLSASVICQRCLEPMAWQPELAGRWLLTKQLQVADEEVDLLLVDQGQVHIWKAVEDELLLALPMVPRHAEQCLDDDVSELVVSEAETQQPAQETRRPFAGLDELMKGKSDKS